MHELSIANSVVDAVRAAALQQPSARVRKVGLRLGELSGVNGESLAFCFEALVQDTELAGVPLHIEVCQRCQRCPRCMETFVVVDYQTACPACGSADTECVGGEELELAYLELEEA
jgi:hydrogenase nickel incorporation protein HypA/HybF